LGAFLADKISNVLVNVGIDYQIVDRGVMATKKVKGKGLQNLLKSVAGSEIATDMLGVETQVKAIESTDAMVNMLGNIPAKDKRLKGVELIIYGTITTIGERYHLDLKAKKKKGDVLVATADGDVSNTLALASLHGASIQMRPATLSNPGPAQFPVGNTNSSDQQFTKQNLQFDLVKCVSKGSSIEIHLRISSLNKDDYLHVYKTSTKIFNQDGGADFAPSSINLADVTTNRYAAEKELIRNSPVESVLTFYPGEDVSVISKLGINCRSKVFGTFYVEMTDIFVE